MKLRSDFMAGETVSLFDKPAVVYYSVENLIQ